MVNIVRGSANSKAKLMEKEVLEIKRLLIKGLSISEIARRYGVHRNTINRIKSGKCWGYLC